MELYNYQDVINKEPIYHLCKKNDRYFYKMLVFKWFYKLDSFYD